MPMKQTTRFKPGVSGNPEARWKPGHSGNPVGKSKRRTQFEEAFNEALITEGSPEEAAKLLWEAARSREPWAVQEVCRRFAPETQSMRLVHEVDDDRLDYSKLTDEQINQLDAILDQASVHPPTPEGGEGTAPVP